MEPDLYGFHHQIERNTGGTMTARTLVVCGIILTMTFGCGKAKESYEKSFKESFKKNFVKSCTESATKAGVKESDAHSKCDCVAAYLVGKYSSFELLKLTARETPESKKIFDAAVNSCQ
jgi:hypothetical protein